MNMATQIAPTPVIKSLQQADSTPGVPILQAGDRLTRTEFERRYRAMSHVKKAELIEGVVYMPSPVSHGDHGRPHHDLNGWLFVYRTATPGVDGGDNSTVRLDADNELQPDGLLRLPVEQGGQSRIVQGYIEGAPEFVAEVAASTASYDLHDKMHVYRRNGVREYLVWRVWDREIDWFILREDRYESLSRGPDGIYRSEVMPGLWLDPAAMVGGDLQRVLSVLQLGIASPEHQSFASKLQSIAKP
jgi:Uma2 family endonuclease